MPGVGELLGIRVRLSFSLLGGSFGGAKAFIEIATLRATLNSESLPDLERKAGESYQRVAV